MFVGWIRNNFESDLEELSQNIVIDKNLVVKTKHNENGLCFGVYNDDNKLVAFITSYEFEKFILINNFYYEQIEDDTKLRLIKLLLNNINSTKSIQVMANETEVHFFKECGFDIYFEFKKAIYTGEAVAFNFSDNMAKSINSENYLRYIKELDFKTFRDDRYEYITRLLIKKSSLFLSNEFCYQHSYALNNSILKVSPWIVKEESFSEAEKLIRGLIYYRGLKKIISIVPNIDEVTSLYKSYKFDLKEKCFLMYKNNKPDINVNTIYAY